MKRSTSGVPEFQGGIRHRPSDLPSAFECFIDGDVCCHADVSSDNSSRAAWDFSRFERENIEKSPPNAENSQLVCPYRLLSTHSLTHSLAHGSQGVEVYREEDALSMIDQRSRASSVLCEERSLSIFGRLRSSLSRVPTAACCYASEQISKCACMRACMHVIVQPTFCDVSVESRAICTKLKTTIKYEN